MAYALQYVVQIIEQDQHKHHLSLHTRSEMESFLGKARSLIDLIETNTFEIVEELENRIREVAHDAEDIIESYIVELLAPEDNSEPIEDLGGRDDAGDPDDTVSSHVVYLIPKECIGPEIRDLLEDFDSIMVLEEGHPSEEEQSLDNTTQMASHDADELVPVPDDTVSSYVVYLIPKECIGPELRDLLEDFDSIMILEEGHPSEEEQSLDNTTQMASHDADELVPVPELALTDIMEKLDSIMKEINMLNTEEREKPQVEVPPLTQSPPVDSSSRLRYLNSEIFVVGPDKYNIRLKNYLTGQSYQLQVIPVVGTGGSGKTALARYLYYNSSNVSHFDVSAWATITLGFNLHFIFLELLNYLMNVTYEMRWETGDEQLGQYVYTNLVNKRYLIVVDDIWHTSVWDKLQRYFPNNHNGSRVILTTREWNLAEYAKTSIKPHQMLPLDEDTSWHLICTKVFGGALYCPTELVEIAKKIARNCKGHPLAIVTMAGFLSKCDTTPDVWQSIESQQLHSTDMTKEFDSIKEGRMPKIDVDPCLKGFVEFFAKDGVQLMSRLMQGQPKLQIIPVIGLGGSGKTTLAGLLYDHALRAKHFDAYARVTVKGKETMGRKQRNVSATLQDLLDSLHIFGMSQVNDADLGVRLHKTLKNRRYLIIVDDIMDAHTWDAMRRFFPDDGNGSRVILTAREWTHNDGITPFCLDSYWEFLLGNVAKLLPTPEKNMEFWKLVEEEHESPTERNPDASLNLLSMSYDTLPYHLKPCFLYMAAFPEDHVIRASYIIQLWIAEGFISSTEENCLEDTALMYLESLISKNLLFATSKSYNGKVISFQVHDIFWKFCQKKALEENFMWFKDMNCQNIPEDRENMRRVSVHPMSQPNEDEDEIILARSFLCIGPTSLDLAPKFLVLRLLRVLDVFLLQFDQFPEAILKLVNLKYMAFSCQSALPSSISMLRNLQTLITSEVPSLPSELWELTQIRHIKCEGTWIWSTAGSGERFLHKELQTLINIPASELTLDFLKHSPNLRKLGIIFNSSNHGFLHLDCLNNLEHLDCSFVLSRTRHDFSPYLGLPASLKELSLSSCIIHSKFMTAQIGSLPFLENLELKKCDLVDLKWESAEGGFPRLRYLLMEDLKLVNWRAKSTHFPDLRCLDIRACNIMHEIPLDIREMQTLELIQVDDKCSSSLLASAKRIQVEQTNLGNDLFRVIFLRGAGYLFKPSPATHAAESSSQTLELDWPMQKPEKSTREELHHTERQNSAGEVHNELLVNEAEEKGYAAFSTGDFVNAIQHYTDAINLSPLDHRLYYLRSEAHTSINKFSEALCDAKKTVELKPELSEGHSRLGKAYMDLQNAKDALSVFKKGLEIDPSDHTLKSNLFNAKAHEAMSTGNFTDSIEHFTNAINFNPLNPGFYYSRSVAYDHLKQYSESLSDAEKSVQLNPNSSRGYSRLANAHLRLGNLEGALSAFKKGHEINPNNDTLNSQFSNTKGLFEFFAGNFVDALHHFTDAINILPSGYYYSCRSQTRCNLRQFLEALPDAQITVQLNPGWSEGYSRLGEIYMVLDNHKDAISSYKEALKIDPNNNFVKTRLCEAQGKVAFSASNFSDTIQHYTDAINLSPLDHRLYSYRCEANIFLNQFSKAMSDAQETVQLNPSSEGYSCLGDVYMGLHIFKSAVLAYEKGLQIRPMNAKLKSALSRAKDAQARRKKDNHQRQS